MSVRFAAVGALVLAAASPAMAGPPYETDDPEPTELGDWEIYNFITADGLGGEIDGEGGLELNYGAARGLQLTTTLPVAFARERTNGWRAARGDVEIGVKYRLVDDEKNALQGAIFPRVILPTDAKGLGGKRARLLLPLWVLKDIGKTSVVGGGGYEINPGSGNRDFWQAGLAVTREIDMKLVIGAELSWESPDTVGSDGSVGINLGLVRKIGGPFALLVAAGPSFSNGKAGYHSYAALAINY